MIVDADTSCKENFIAERLIIDDDYEIVLEEHSRWSNKWRHNTYLAVEAMIVLNLVQVVVRKMEKASK